MKNKINLKFRKINKEVNIPVTIAIAGGFIFFVFIFFVYPGMDTAFQRGKSAGEVREASDGKYNIFADILLSETKPCFQAGMEYDNGVKVSCELSGVGYFANRLYFVNDTPIPGYPSVLNCRYRLPVNFRDGKYLGNKKLKNIVGYQDVAVSPNLRYLFLLSSFEDSPLLSGNYAVNNNLITYMPIDYPDSSFFAPRKSLVVKEILNFRKQIQKALSSKLYPEGPDYFKAEALSIVSDSIMLIGISRIGKSVENSVPVAIVVEVGYYIGADNTMMIISSPKKSYELLFDDYQTLEKNLYITGMDYDYYNKALFITTAYHNGNTSMDIGGFLWRINFKDYQLHKPADIVYSAAKQPLHFAHKPSGVAVVDEETVFVICNDERITGEEKDFDPRKEFKRELNQAAYYVLQIYF